MNYNGNKAENVKIAYIGGGSRGWAWGLMSDRAMNEDMSGDIYLYDIDFEAARDNEIIGNKIKDVEGCKSVWNYRAVKTIGEALTDANFVVISILPGTFDEMQSDVHAPEEFGIYQSVGDTSGPGGIIRALRTIPMFEEIAKNIERYCPEAWVINYTNPMTICVKTLYSTFPEIKAFGCCHEVFGTQKLLINALSDIKGIDDVKREDIKVNVVGVNHFTWLTEASYRDINLYPVYKEFCDKYYEEGYGTANINWFDKNISFHYNRNKVKFDLFRRYGCIAAAGDRHLAEFCEGSWYLADDAKVAEMRYGLTPVSWRKEDLEERRQKSKELVSGTRIFELSPTGEEGVEQMRALLGLRDLTTNVNIPNYGQIPNLPLGVVVETNASFRTNSLKAVMAGEIPQNIYPLIARIVGEQEIVAEAGRTRDLDLAFNAFANDPLVRLDITKAKVLFNKMIDNTKAYLTMYDL